MCKKGLIPGREDFVLLLEGIPWTFKVFISRAAFSEHEIKFYTLAKDKEYKGYLCAHVSTQEIPVSEGTVVCFVSCSVACRGSHCWECYGRWLAESFVELQRLTDQLLY